MYDLPISPENSLPIGSVGGGLANVGVSFQNERQVIDKIRGASNNPHESPEEFQKMTFLVDKKPETQQFYHQYEDFDIFVIPDELKR